MIFIIVVVFKVGKCIMATCPKCNGTIPYLRLMKHTRWTPVKCPQCHSQLHFDKRDWLKKSGTLFLLLLLLTAICLIGAWARPSFAYVVIMALTGPILLVKFMFDVKNIKLQEAVQEDNRKI
jgi:CXXC-20-CXXC protein